jgi:hypothetical protein
VVGLSYTLGRLISVLSFLGVLVLAFLAVRREAGGRLSGALWGIGAVGLIASSFQHTGAWYDLVRNDSLYLLLVTACLFLIRYRIRSWRALIAAGVLAGLAFLTKQTASFFIIFSGLAVLVMAWRRVPVYVAVVGLVAGGSVLLLNHLSDGWFWRYTYEMHQGHDLYWERIWPQTEIKLFWFFPAVAVVMGLWLLVALGSWIWRRALPDPADRSLIFWLVVAITGVAISAVGFATQWAVENAYIPGLVFPAIFVCMAGGNLAVRWAGRAALAGGVLALLVGIGLTGQLLQQLYKPAKHIPTPGDRETGAALIDLLRQVKGPVLVPYHPYYPVLAGKRPSYHQMGTNDVTRAGYPFPPDIVRRILSKHYAVVLLDNPPRGRYDFLFGSYKLQRYFHAHEVPKIVTGYNVRPTYLFVPKGDDPAPAGSRRVLGFESGSFEGWDLEGSAFGRKPAGGPVWTQGPVGPFEGSFLANSYHGGDPGRGSMRSPEFTVDRPVLTYRVGGGNRPGEIMVRLLVEGQEVHRGTGPGSDIMQERRVDVSAHRGKRMRVELVDRAVGPWGHLLFDDLMLRER